MLATHSRYAVNATAKIHRLDGDQYPHLRRYLNQTARLQNSRISPVTSSPAMLPKRTVNRFPAAPTNSTTVPELAEPMDKAGPISTNFALGALAKLSLFELLATRFLSAW